MYSRQPLSAAEIIERHHQLISVSRVYTSYTWMCVRVFSYICIHTYSTQPFFSRCRPCVATISRLLKLQVSFAKEPYKRDDILQKRPVILTCPLGARSLTRLIRVWNSKLYLYAARTRDSFTTTCSCIVICRNELPYIFIHAHNIYIQQSHNIHNQQINKVICQQSPPPLCEITPLVNTTHTQDCIRFHMLIFFPT